MSAILRTFVLLCLAFAALSSARAQMPNYTVSIDNVCVEGTTLFFSLFMENAGGQGFYLASSDFVVEYNEANFCSATYTIVNNDGRGILPHYLAELSVVNSSPGRRALALALFAPEVETEDEFNQLARFLAPGEKIRIASLAVTNICQPTGLAGLRWSEGLLKTDIFAFQEFYPWHGYNITNGATFIAPGDVPLIPSDCPDEYHEPGQAPGLITLQPNPAFDHFRARVSHPNYYFSVVSVYLYDLHGNRITQANNLTTTGDGTTGQSIAIPADIVSGSYIVEMRDTNNNSIGAASLVVVR